MRHPILFCLLVAFGLEGALRLRQYLKYGTTSTSFYEFEVHAASGLRIPKPSSEVGPIRINSLGFRGPEVEMPKPDGCIRVAFLGGSTTFCAEASALEQTWPHLVIDELSRRYPDSSFDYVNGGSGGFATQHSTTSFDHRVAPLAPDVVVIYHGTNDLTLDSRALASERGIYDPNVMESTGAGSVSLAWFLIQKNLRFHRNASSDDRPKLEFDPRELSRDYRERLLELVAKARAQAPVVVLVTFSHRVRAEQSPEEQLQASAMSRYYMPFMDVEGLLAGFEEYNRVVREVAQETGVLLVEGERSIPGDAVHFADSVHLTDAGSALQARRVIEALAADGAFRDLVESPARE